MSKGAEEVRKAAAKPSENKTCNPGPNLNFCYGHSPHLLADAIHVHHLQLLQMHLCPHNSGACTVLDLGLGQHHLQSCRPLKPNAS